MTCIVGYVEKASGDVYIGGDSAGVSNGLITVRKDPKVFKRNGMLVGFTSSYRMGQLLRYVWKIPDREKGMSTDVYIHTFVVYSIIELFRKHSYLITHDGRAEGGCLLLGYKGELFRIDSNFAVAQHEENYIAIGSGRDYAYGALYALQHNEITPVVRIRTALSAARKFSTTVCEPYKILAINKKGGLLLSNCNIRKMQ